MSFLRLQGLFLMRAQGPGTIGVAAYGAIEQYNLAPGEIRDVDNGHLVAWSGNCEYQYVGSSMYLWRASQSAT